MAQNRNIYFEKNLHQKYKRIWVSFLKGQCPGADI